MMESVIRDLKAERARLDKAIATLEATCTGHVPRRGRRTFSDAERAAVSRRMKRYWARRRRRD